VAQITVAPSGLVMTVGQDGRLSSYNVDVTMTYKSSLCNNTTLPLQLSYIRDDAGNVDGKWFSFKLYGLTQYLSAKEEMEGKNLVLVLEQRQISPMGGGQINITQLKVLRSTRSTLEQTTLNVAGVDPQLTVPIENLGKNSTNTESFSYIFK
jgi:hypothetical protein